MAKFNEMSVATRLLVLIVVGFLLSAVVYYMWFNPKMQAFSPNNVIGALRHLGVPPNEYDKVWVAVKALRVEFGRPNLKCIDARYPSPPGE